MSQDNGIVFFGLEKRAGNCLFSEFTKIKVEVSSCRINNGNRFKGKYAGVVEVERNVRGRNTKKSYVCPKKASYFRKKENFVCQKRKLRLSKLNASSVPKKLSQRIKSISNVTQPSKRPHQRVKVGRTRCVVSACFKGTFLLSSRNLHSINIKNYNFQCKWMKKLLSLSCDI